MRSDQCTFNTVWSEDDGEFVGVCKEFPGLSWLDKDRERALQGIVELVEQSIQDIELNGEAVSGCRY